MNDEPKLKTGSMLNPECQKCSKKDTCNNKTLCAYLIPDLIAKEVEKSLNNFDIKINIGEKEICQINKYMKQ